jgi:hypothetical protein
MSKTKNSIDDLYLINLDVEDDLIELENEQIAFVGESERARQISLMKFVRVRNVLIKFSQAFTKDEFKDIMGYLKQFVIIKK